MMQQINQKDFLNKTKEVKIGRKKSEWKQVFSNLEKFYKVREEVLNLLKDYT